MGKEVPWAYTYKFPEPTDEEIQKEIDAMGFTGIIEPNDVRSHYRNKIQEAFCEKVKENLKLRF